MFEPTEKQKELLEKKLKLIGREYYLPGFESQKEFQDYLEKLDKKIQKYFENKNKPKQRDKEKLYNYCLKLIERFGLYTENKLREKMAQKSSQAEGIDYVIDKLKGQNLIDDEKYADIVIEQQLNKGKGYYQITRKLQEKGYTGEKEPSEEDEYESLVETMKKLMEHKDFSDLSDQKIRQKFLSRLQRKGYRFNLVLSAIRNFEEEGIIPKIQYKEEDFQKKDKDIEKDAQKVIQKFRFNDLKDYKQKSKFIQKMLYRGYSYEEINDYLKESE